MPDKLSESIDGQGLKIDPQGMDPRGAQLGFETFVGVLLFRCNGGKECYRPTRGATESLLNN